MEGYPPIAKKGEYKVIEEKDNTMTLLLYNKSGNGGKEDSKMKLFLDRKNNTLAIDRPDSDQMTRSTP